MVAYTATERWRSPSRHVPTLLGSHAMIDDASYHRARAEAEKRLAEQATLPRVRDAHLELARLHSYGVEQAHPTSLQEILNEALER